MGVVLLCLQNFSDVSWGIAVKIENPKDYFDCVIYYNLEQYKNKPDFLPAAFNLSNSLFNMCEWMWHAYEHQLGVNILAKNDYVRYVVKSCPSFRYIRDLANASKHVILNLPSTKMVGISDAVAAESGFGRGEYGVGKFARGSVFIDNGGVRIDFEDAADEVFDFWMAELKRFND